MNLDRRQYIYVFIQFIDFWINCWLLLTEKSPFPRKKTKICIRMRFLQRKICTLQKKVVSLYSVYDDKLPLLNDA